ncbi:FtsX-like permease family protein [Salinibacterium soli]|uniref:ABC3 transporter permease C-terminal domain-containing protein n=1 Tax=Antiquaquibacter soli TaxID=3064523 RepID=A0ABT9BMJ9_9MICO|nr:FtsX-like permease family protein [Protaetiibacter sp. WY-16]MDO7882228.1 hypothetical protein [Protaetiibacter sp. WY-16]
MHPARLAARGMAAQAPLLAAIGAIVLVVTGLLAGIPRFLEAASTASARAALESADATDAAARAQVRLSSDAAAQSAAMDSVLDPLLEGVDAEVLRSVQSDAVTVALPDGREAGIRFLADPLAAARIDVAEGAWPSDGTALPEALAAELGLTVGDVLAVGDHELTVSALWEPIDPGAPAWFGTDTEAALLSEADLVALDVNPFAVWTLLPELDSLDAARVGGLGVAARSWEAAIRADSELARGGVLYAGGLADTVTTIERAIASARGVSPLPLVVVGVVGAIALAQLTRLLTAVRSAETLLLRARGRSPRSAALAAALESAVIGIPAAALGALLAVLLVPGPSALGSALTAIGVVAAAVLIATGLSAAAARSARAPGRAALGGYVAAVVLAAVAAGLGLWRLRLLGSPVIATPDGGTAVDGLAVLAAPLGVLALSLVAAAALPLAFSAGERLAARSPRLAPTLIARQLARRPGEFAVPVVLTALAVASAVLASSYSASWADLTERAGELRNGAALRVQLAGASTVGGAATIASSPRFALDDASAAPVLVAPTESGEDEVTLIALAGSDLDVVSPLGGELDRAALAAAIATPSAGAELDATATRLSVRASVSTTPLDPGAPLAPRQGELSLTAWVSDAQGALARLALDDDGSGVLSTALPEGVAPWTVVAIDAAVATGPIPARYAASVEFDDAETPADWVVQSEAGTPADPGAGLGFVLTATEPSAPLTVRLMAPAGDSPRLAVSAAFAHRLGLDEGSPVRLRFAGSGLAVEGVVSSIVAQLPGTTEALTALVDLRALTDSVLRVTSSVPRPDQIWIDADDPVAAAAALQPVLPSGAVLTTVESGSGQELQRPVVAALWIGAAGSLLLAAAAAIAVSVALLRSRRGETVALRAIGMRDRDSSTARGVELVLVLVLGALAGTAAGLVVAQLTVGELARSAVLDAPRSLPAPVLLDVPALSVAVAVVAVLTAATAAVTSSAVLAMARRSTGREVDA